MSFYYSTQPYLAWCLNRYFYNGIHFLYVATDFYPYLTNPKSSNPLLVYQDLYHPWQNRDDFDKFVIQTRLNIRIGVEKRLAKGIITSGIATRLKTVCDKIEIAYFYPVLYRVDVSKISSSRLKSAGSGLRGSREYLIEDLNEVKGEFDIVFLDYSGDADFDNLKTLPIGDPGTALSTLENRCKP